MMGRLSLLFLIYSWVETSFGAEYDGAGLKSLSSKTKQGGLGVQDQPWIHGKFENGLWNMRPCLKKQKQKQKNQNQPINQPNKTLRLVIFM